MKRTRLLAGLLVTILAGCASDPTIRTSAVEPIPLAPARSASAGDWAVSIVGTPFLLVFRTVVCAGSLVVAAPASALLVLGNSPEGLASLSDGVAQNCGGPYVLAPAHVS